MNDQLIEASTWTRTRGRTIMSQPAGCKSHTLNWNRYIRRDLTFLMEHVEMCEEREDRGGLNSDDPLWYPARISSINKRTLLCGTHQWDPPEWPWIRTRNSKHSNTRCCFHVPSLHIRALNAQHHMPLCPCASLPWVCCSGDQSIQIHRNLSHFSMSSPASILKLIPNDCDISDLAAMKKKLTAHWVARSLDTLLQ